MHNRAAFPRALSPVTKGRREEVPEGSMDRAGVSHFSSTFGVSEQLLEFDRPQLGLSREIAFLRWHYFHELQFQ